MWKCSEDGTELVDDALACPVCGKPRWPCVVVLEGETAGVSTRAHITTAFGRAVLKTLCPADYVYADQTQFRLVRDDEARCWRLEHAAGARNVTLFDGKSIPAGGIVIGPEGGLITIGEGHLKIRVSLQY